MTTLEALKTAYHLLDDKARWTTYAQARDVHGQSVGGNNPRAVSWCAAGALVHATGVRFNDGKRYDRYMESLQLLADVIEPGSTISVVPGVNNGPNGYELIRAAFRKAIADATPREERQVEAAQELVAV